MMTIIYLATATAGLVETGQSHKLSLLLNTDPTYRQRLRSYDRLFALRVKGHNVFEIFDL